MYPQAYIAWVVEEQYQELLRGHPDLDDVIAVSIRKWKRNSSNRGTWRRIRDIIRPLRKRRFDLVLDFQGLLKSAVLAYITGAKRRVGFAREYAREPVASIFYTQRIVPRRKHIIEQNLEFLSCLGFWPETTRTRRLEGAKAEGHNPDEHSFGVQETAIKLGPFLKEKVDITRFLALSGCTGAAAGEPRAVLVGVNPGAAWETKRWGADNYVELGKRLAARSGVRVVVCWGPGEEKLSRAIVDGIGPGAYLACRTSICQLVELIRCFKLFIAPDTGPLHIAAAMGVPTVALYGPSDPQRNGPYGPRHEIVHPKLSCSGCFQRRCNSLECLRLITVDEVWEKAAQQLDRLAAN